MSTAHVVPLSFSLAAAFFWGTSDFLGGYASRKVNTFLLTTIAHASGSLFMIALALLHHSVFPARSSIGWAVAAGLSGGAALAVFYRVLGSGHMGLAAPVSAVVAAAIPAAVGMLAQGLPGRIQIEGFLVAGLGIWLVCRTEDGAPPEGMGLAVLAAVGFAGYFLFIDKAGGGSVLWIAACARLTSLALTAVIVLLRRDFTMTGRSAALAVLAGFVDISGSALFLRGAQTGRLDAAVIVSSLYPAFTVLWARLILKEHFTRWQVVGMFAALVAVPMIAG